MITIHESTAEDFSTLGLGMLTPTECIIEEVERGIFQLSMTHPFDMEMRWALIENDRVIRVPAPIRETPLVEIGNTGSTVTRQIYQVTTSGKRLRLRTKPSDSVGKIIGSYKTGTKVIKIGESGTWTKVILKVGGASGWMATSNLSYVGTENETITGDTPGGVVAPRQTRDQLFVISSVSRDTVNGVVQVEAEHISYDLKGNVVDGEYVPKNVSASEAGQQVMAKLMNPHEFTLYSNLTTQITGDYSYVNGMEAFLDPDQGVAVLGKARLIRDNFDIFLLNDEDRDFGVTIRHRKNLKGANLTIDKSGIVTRIIPVGKTKDGHPLYLADPIRYIDSSHIGDYRVIYARKIEYDVQVGDGDGEFATVALARAELQRLAQADFDADIDLPSVGLDVDFVLLENTLEYAAYADLQRLHLYDTVRVVAAYAGIDAKLRVTGYKWDAIRKRYISLTLGQIESLDTTVYGFNLADGTVYGTKLVGGSVDGDRALRSLSVGYGKFTAAAVGQLSADAIVAIKARIQELVAGNITTDELYAALAQIAVAQITTANIGTANIDWANIGTLVAEIARLAKAEINTANINEANINWAVIANLTAQIATVAQAQITTANIVNANIDWASIANLTAAVASIAKAHIGDADIDWASITNLTARIATLARAEITTANINSANIQWATINSLVAAISDIALAKIGSADIDYAKIKDLVTGTAIIEEGVGGKLYISRLAVNEANMVNLTVGKLMVKGEDGLFYHIGVDGSGNPTATLVEVEGDNVADRTIGAGKIILNSITTTELNADQIFGNEAILNKITAGLVDTGRLIAQEGFVAQLESWLIHADIIEGINGTLVLLGEQIELKAAKTQVDALSGTVSTNTGQISTMSGQIALKASQADVDELGDDLGDTNAALSLKANSSDVSAAIAASAEGLQAQINVVPDAIELAVGSRETGVNNLIRNGGFDFGTYGFGSLWGVADWGTATDKSWLIHLPTDEYSASMPVDVPVFHCHTNALTSGAYGIYWLVSGLRKNTKYTFSAYVLQSGLTGLINMEAIESDGYSWVAVNSPVDVSQGADTSFSSFKRVKVTFDPGYFINFRLAIVHYPHAGDAWMWVARTKLEQGDAPTGWTPHESEVIGAKLMLHDGRMSYSGDELEFDVSGTAGDMHLGPEGLTIPQINSPSIHPRYTGPSSLYVTKSATDAQVAARTHFRSLGAALAALSNVYLTYGVSISIANDTYYEGQIVLDGLSGSGGLYVFGNNANLANSMILVRYCQTPINIQDLSITAMSGADRCIGLLGSKCMALRYVTVTGNSGAGSYGVIVEDGSPLFAEGCVFYDWDRATLINSGSIGTFYNCKGNCSHLAVFGTMILNGTQPSPTTTLAYDNVYGLVQNNGATVDMGASAPDVPVTHTATFVATVAHTVYGSSQWPGTQMSITDYIFQGYTSGSHFLVGELWFPGVSALAGKTILSAKLRLRRETGGWGDVVEITAYYGARAYNSAGSPTPRYSMGVIGTIASGGSLKDFAIPTAAVEFLRANPTEACIAFSTGESAVAPGYSYSRNYAKFNAVGSGYVPELVVTYSD